MNAGTVNTNGDGRDLCRASSNLSATCGSNYDLQNSGRSSPNEKYRETCSNVCRGLEAFERNFTGRRLLGV